MDDLTGLVPLNLRDGAVTAPFDLTAGQAARAEALDADDQLAALHEAGHAVMACVANSPHDGSAGGPPFPVSAIDIKSRRPRVELAEEDDNMPRWHTASRYRALIVVDLGGWAAERIVLGEPTTGGDADLKNATTRAIQMISHGLDDSAPLLSHEAFGGYGNPPGPSRIGGKWQPQPRSPKVTGGPVSRALSRPPAVSTPRVP